MKAVQPTIQVWNWIAAPLCGTYAIANMIWLFRELDLSLGGLLIFGAILPVASISLGIWAARKKKISLAVAAGCNFVAFVCGVVTWAVFYLFAVGTAQV